MNIRQQIEDELYHTALETVAYVATGKAIVRENAKRFGVPACDVEKAMHEAATKIMAQLNELRNRDRDRRLKKLKALHQKMTTLHAKLGGTNNVR